MANIVNFGANTCQLTEFNFTFSNISKSGGQSSTALVTMNTSGIIRMELSNFSISPSGSIAWAKNGKGINAYAWESWVNQNLTVSQNDTLVIGFTDLVNSLQATVKIYNNNTNYLITQFNVLINP